MSKFWTPIVGLDFWAQQKPNARFLIQPRDGASIEYSWQEVQRQARCFANYLLNENYAPGTCIAVVSRNCAESLICDLGIWMAGCVSVQVYPSLNAETLRYILEHCEARCLLLGQVDDWSSMKSGVPDGLPLIHFPGAPVEQLQQNYLSWKNILDCTDASHVKSSIRPEDLARIIYTSGSTGKPKGVMIPFSALCAARNILRDIGGADERDRLISYLPFAHAFECNIIHNSSVNLGCEVFFSEGVATFGEDLRRARPTIFHSVPRLWIKFQQAIQQKIPASVMREMLEDPDTAEDFRNNVLGQIGIDCTRVALGGSAPLADSVIHWYRDLGLELLEGYGMSEDFAYSHLSRVGEVRVGYVGSPLPGVQSRLSASGEVEVNSPAKMAGYYKNAAATAESFTADGWFKTGDLGEFDDRGRLRLKGRVKEIFKTSKGKYVAPAPIESAISHPLVENLCVVGEGQPSPCVLVVPGSEAIEALGENFDRTHFEKELLAVIDNVNATLDPHQQLAFVVLVAEPWGIANNLLTPTLKLKRNEIEARYAAKLDDWYRLDRRLIWEAA